jgi:hypothetical protein
MYARRSSDLGPEPECGYSINLVFDPRKGVRSIVLVGEWSNLISGNERPLSNSAELERTR